MKLNFTFCAITAFCLLNTQVLHSQSLTQIYDLAKTNDLQYQANIAQFNANKEIEAISRGSLLPQISGNMSYGTAETDTTTTSTLNFAPSVDSNGNSTTDTLSYSLSLEQALINFSALNTYRSGKIQAAAAEVQLAADKQSLIIRSAQAYFDVLSATDQLKTSQSEEKALETQLEQTRQRYEVGLISINDVHEAQANFDNTVAQDIITDNVVELRLEQMREITGKYHDKLSVLNTENFSATRPSPEGVDNWLKIAEQKNLDLMVRSFSKDIAKDDIASAKAGHYPTLSLNGSYGRNDTKINGNGNFPARDNNSIGLNLSIPIYSGGAVSAQTTQARYRFVAASEDLELAYRSTVRSVRSAYNDVIASTSTIRALQQAVVSADSALKATEAGFDVGTRTIVDVLNSTRNQFDARQKLASARYDFISAILDLKRASGNLTEQDLVDINRGLMPDKVS